MHHQNKVFANLIALLIGTLLALLLGCILLETYFGKNNLHFIHQPNLSQEIYPPKEIVRGHQIKIRFSTNQQGMRGVDYPKVLDTYRILTMGGSTTLCAYLDDDKTWPALVQKMLKITADSCMVWLGNIGKDGLTTRNHVLQMLYFIPQYPVDAILILAGINDLVARLWFHEKYDPHFLEDENNRRFLMFATFSRLPDWKIFPFYKRFGLWKLARRVRRYLENRLDQEENIARFLQWRSYHQTGRKISTAPNLTSALQEYEANIRKIVELAERNNTRIIFMTQPVLWHGNMTQEEKNVLLFGFIGDPCFLADHAHYSSEVLAACMKLYNEKLLQLCQQLNVEAIDLASMLPQSLEVFYDDCHFTDLGAELVANVVVDYLKNKPSF